MLRPPRALLRLSAPLVAAALALPSCADPEFIELRLAPCDADALPRSVRVRIQPYDEGGGPLGEAKNQAFEIADPGLFDDGFATIAYAPPTGAATATFTVAWFTEPTAGTLNASQEVVTLTRLALPPLGDPLELSAAGCAPWTDTSTSTGTDTATTDGTDTAGTATDGTTTDTTATTGATDSTTTTGSTTDGTTTTTTDGTTTTTDGTTTDGTSTTDGTTTDDTTTGGDTIEGTPCAMNDPDTCETAEPGGVGKLYSCIGGEWTENADAVCGLICKNTFYGYTLGVAVGCSGNGTGTAWGCLCGEGQGQAPCTDVDQQCTIKDMSQLLQLCIGGDLFKATCPETCSDDPAPICTN
jgi:hypothetical protein